jgi:hypothetical protein
MFFWNKCPSSTVNRSILTMHSSSQMQTSPEMKTKALVLTATGNTGGLPTLCLVVCVVPAPPRMPTYGHIDTEQVLSPFPGTS